MFFARPFSASAAEALVLAGLGMWVLLLFLGITPLLRRIRALIAVVAPLVLAAGAYALAFKTKTMLAHHELLDLRAQGVVASLLLLASMEPRTLPVLYRTLASFGIAALIFRMADFSQFFNLLRHGLLVLNVGLVLTILIRLTPGLLRIARARKQLHV